MMAFFKRLFAAPTLPEPETEITSELIESRSISAAIDVELKTAARRMDAIVQEIKSREPHGN